MPISQGSTWQTYSCLGVVVLNVMKINSVTFPTPSAPILITVSVIMAMFYITVSALKLEVWCYCFLMI